MNMSGEPVLDEDEGKIFSGTVTVPPSEGLKGEVSVPGDKSISHRAVIIGSIAYGVTEVEGFLEGEDNLSTLDAFRSMGVVIEKTGPFRLRINGTGLHGLTEPEDVIDASNSGTTARLLTGLLSAQPFFSVITGDATLRKRPMRRVVEPLLKMGASITGRKGGSLLPLAVTGRPLKGIDYSTTVASAQLKSALLLAGLYAEGETSVTEPEKSRDHTERMLRLFGAEIGGEGTTVTVKKASKNLRGGRVVVPGDISSASFFMAAASIVGGSEVVIRNVGVNPTRTGLIEVLKRMGGSVSIENEREVSGEPVADIAVKSSALKGMRIDGKLLLSAIDEFPIICVIAAFASGETSISGAGELRVKESDRIAAMAESLRRFGIRNEEREDGIVIEGTGGRKTGAKGVEIESGGDHRIAMAAAVAGLMAEGGVSIRGAGSVDVSFPGFFSVLESLRS